ncbi:mycothiol acetyltransferase [mine drainage metagenome]|uniref:Mycothiol acetyltransferase n=1 Tax=mine drainage metagenome TaxID=410659 RepID=A0A1J5RZN8_9ZZZZ
MNITIRKATINDVAVIAPLFDGYRIFYKQTADLAGAEKFISDRINKNESVIFLAEENNKAVGFTQLYPIFSSVGMKRCWLLNDLFVAPDARGKGVADALLQTAQQFGAETNSRWLMLQTAVDNYAAQKVYERNGWKKEQQFFTYNYALDK